MVNRRSADMTLGTRDFGTQILVRSFATPGAMHAHDSPFAFTRLTRHNKYRE